MFHRVSKLRIQPDNHLSIFQGIVNIVQVPKEYCLRCQVTSQQASRFCKSIIAEDQANGCAGAASQLIPQLGYWFYVDSFVVVLGFHQTDQILCINDAINLFDLFSAELDAEWPRNASSFQFKSSKDGIFECFPRSPSGSVSLLNASPKIDKLCVIQVLDHFAVFYFRRQSVAPFKISLLRLLVVVNFESSLKPQVAIWRP